MAPAAVWAALTVGLQLWAAVHAVPTQVTSIPYDPKTGSMCQLREYYDKTVQKCCGMCPPGQRVKHFCTKTTDTVCADCEDSTYTQLWNWVSKCLGCGSRCSSNQVETQVCTRERNRVCACRQGWYCMLRKQDGCRLCMPLSRCRPGFGVARLGTVNSDVVCAPCAPGTFSNTTSSTDACSPHRTCDVVAIPGNSSMDAVCMSVSATLHTVSGTAHTPQTVSTRSQPVETTLEPSPALSTSLTFSESSRPPVGGIRVGMGLPIGLIVGVTSLSLLVVGLVYCVFVSQKKKKSSCLQREVKEPHLPAEKEQQHLLTTAPSSSSSSLESSASTGDRRVPPRHQTQAPTTGKDRGSGEAGASSRSSESSPGSHGTQVNVTCIVNVCSSSDHGSQCSSQASTTMGDSDASPSGSSEDEQVPFSKEECPFQSQLETPETLLQSLEEKPVPLGVPEAGMKLS
ncbi:tumor necrosis factor receptor superfamily member 1B [Castor canadensis]|uniref:Tumor necrosis factor receptor superfamily member 1B n=1 Tax=Castor canadensis TaxID=51338 RepID=A0A250YIK7_CASCN|nr:tumor necrosis factor receptor superfamily member 1B [Castor canadensis]